MTTLTDFLLARIAEDEGGVRDWHLLSCDNLLCPECTAGPFPCNCPAPNRVLVDCEVKRWIIGTWASFESVKGGDLTTTLTASGAAMGLGLAIRRLAFAYADHPDYQAEWAIA